MSAHATRATIDLDARQHESSHARWALALAVLAIPGVTVAWGLPAGGFWIGVPLATVALVLGIRARPGRMATAAAVIAGACLALVVLCTVALSL